MAAAPALAVIDSPRTDPRRGRDGRDAARHARRRSTRRRDAAGGAAAVRARRRASPLVPAHPSSRDRRLRHGAADAPRSRDLYTRRCAAAPRRPRGRSAHSSGVLATTPPTARREQRASIATSGCAQFDRAAGSRPRIAPGTRDHGAHLSRGRRSVCGHEAADALPRPSPRGPACRGRTSSSRSPPPILPAPRRPAGSGARRADYGRLGTPAARVPAMVMNVLPLRVAADEDAPLAELLLDGVADACSARAATARYRSEQLRRDLGLLGGERRLYGPLVNVLPFDEPPGSGRGSAPTARAGHRPGRRPHRHLPRRRRRQRLAARARRQSRPVLDDAVARMPRGSSTFTRAAAVPQRSPGECRRRHASRSTRSGSSRRQRHRARRAGDDADRADRAHDAAHRRRPPPLSSATACPELCRARPAHRASWPTSCATAGVGARAIVAPSRCRARSSWSSRWSRCCAPGAAYLPIDLDHPPRSQSRTLGLAQPRRGDRRRRHGLSPRRRVRA